MMEVTPHLKTVLKNYQHSATKSLQGPGLSTLTSPSKLNEPLSPEINNKEEEYVPAPFPVQQLPILTTPDTSCSERTETVLEGETISCFVVGGEKRLCLPQVLKWVLRDFAVHQINQECDHLQIYCSRCTPEQLNVLKNQGILPSSATSSGLITKTDAERLCSALLHTQPSHATQLRPPRGTTSFSVYHECFGKCQGVCFPDLYTSKVAKCIMCSECGLGFTPQQFVCHVHKPENRTVHWGFDSANWRTYIRVGKNQNDTEQYIKYLDDMKEQYDGNQPFPLPQNIYAGIKRKQVLAQEMLKDHELPLKKQKFGDFLNSHILPYHIYTLDPLYLHQYLQECTPRHTSAFKAVNNHHNNHIKEPKSYHPINLNRFPTDPPPILQDPKRVVLLSESERFESNFQPNVALAPTPKKHRYVIPKIEKKDEDEHYHEVTIKREIPEELPPINNNVTTTTLATAVTTTPKAVSVVQTAPPPPQLPRYNSEIELSTDTEDSASETSEKPVDFNKIEEVIRDVEQPELRDRILELFKTLTKDKERIIKELQTKDERIKELEDRLNNYDKIKIKQENPNSPPITTTTNLGGGFDEKLIKQEEVDDEQNGVVVDGGRDSEVLYNGVSTTTSDKDDSSSSIIKNCCDDNHIDENDNQQPQQQQQLNEGQKSVIASLETEPKAITNTAPE